MELSKLLPHAIEAALKAGDAIMKVYESRELDIQIKSDKSPVTRADMESAGIINSVLYLTKLPVITEEDSVPDYSIRKQWEAYWLVDPLDGTKEFIKRNGEFTVNIALVLNNMPILGVVLIPDKKAIYFALKGEGAFKNERILFTSNPNEVITSAQKIKPMQRTIPGIISSRSHVSSETSAFMNRFEAKYGKFEKITSGSTIKLCFLAEGKADIYPRYGTTMEWDTAAGEVIAGEAGVGLFSTTGQPLQYNKQDLKNPSFIAYNPLKFHFEGLF